MDQNPYILLNLESYHQNRRTIWLTVCIGSLLIHLGTLGIILLLISPNQLFNKIDDPEIPVEIITINPQPTISQKPSPSQSSHPPNLDAIIAKTQQLESELSQVKSSPNSEGKPLSTPRITPLPSPNPLDRKPISNPNITPSPSPNQEVRKPISNPNIIPSPSPNQEARKPLSNPNIIPSPSPNQEARKPASNPNITASPSPNQEARKPISSPTSSPETITKPSPSPPASSPNLNQQETAFKPSVGGGIIARIENLRITQANRDIIDQEATIKQPSQTFPSVDYLTSQGISLAQDLEIEVLAIIQPDGRVKLVSASGFTKISQGNLNIDQAEQLAAEILENWLFEPAYMGNQPVARDYFIQLKLSPTQN